jgi:hypothetical protein
MESLDDILFTLRFHRALDLYELDSYLQKLIPYLHSDPRCRGVLLETLELLKGDWFPDEIANFMLEHFPDDPGVWRMMQRFGLHSYGHKGELSQSVHRLCYRRRREDPFWLACAVHGCFYDIPERRYFTGKEHHSTCVEIVDSELWRGNFSLLPVWAAQRRNWDTTVVPLTLIDPLQAYDLKRKRMDGLGVQPPMTQTASAETRWMKNEPQRHFFAEEYFRLPRIFERWALRSAPEIEPLLVLAQVDQGPESRDYLLEEWRKLKEGSEAERLLLLILAWKFGEEPAVASALGEAYTLRQYSERFEPLTIHFNDPTFSKSSDDESLWEALKCSLYFTNKDDQYFDIISRLIIRFGHQDRARYELIRRLKNTWDEGGACLSSLVALALCWPDHPETRVMIEKALFSSEEGIQDVAARILGRLYIGVSWADALLRSALLESCECLAEYLVRNLGNETVVDEAFELMEHLPDNWERSKLYQCAPQCIVAFFGPRHDLLGRLAELMNRTPHKRLRDAIDSLLNAYSSLHEQRMGSVSAISHFPGSD